MNNNYYLCSMKRKVLVFYILTILCMLCSCGNHKLDKELAQVDSLADVDLEAAKAIFDSIADYIEDDTKSNRMYYRLLRIKIADKSYEEFTSDKEINLITSYFEGEKDKYRLAESYFYAGRVCELLNNPSKAAVYFNKVLKIDSTNTKPALLSRCYQNMSTMYVKQFKLKIALKYARMALVYAKNTDDKTLLAYSLVNVSKLSEDDHEVESLITEAKEIVKEGCNKELYNEVVNCLIMCCIDNDDYDKALTYCDSIDTTALKYDGLDGHHYILGAIYDEIGNTDSAIHYYNKVMAESKSIERKLDVASRLSNVYSKLGNSKLASQYIEQHRELNESVFVQRERNDIKQAVLNAKEEAVEIDDTSDSAWSTAVITACIVIACALLVAYLVRRKKNVPATPVSEPAEVTLVQKDVATSSAPAENVDDIQARLMKLYTHFQSLAEKEKNPTADDWAELAEAIDQSVPNFLLRISSDVKLSKSEQRICMLLRLGIAFKDIATLNNSTVAAVYVTSRRLGSKVRGVATTPTQWSEYINSI